jgi:hypothetical protein
VVISAGQRPAGSQVGRSMTEVADAVADMRNQTAEPGGV